MLDTADQAVVLVALPPRFLVIGCVGSRAVLGLVGAAASAVDVVAAVVVRHAAPPSPPSRRITIHQEPGGSNPNQGNRNRVAPGPFDVLVHGLARAR